MKEKLLKNSIRQFHFFEKSSSEALDTILNALNAEVDEAIAQKRFPHLEKALNRLYPNASLKNPI